MHAISIVRGGRSAVPLFLLVALISLVLALPRGMAHGQDVDATLAGLTDAGIVPQSLVDNVRTNGSINAIVEYDTSVIDGASERSRDASGLVALNAPLLEAKAANLDALKSSALDEAGSGVTVLKNYENIGLQYVRFESPAALAEFASLPGVRAVHPNKTMQPKLAQSLNLIDQPRAERSGYGGAGVTVAVLDTGLDYLQPHFGCTAVGVPVDSCRVTYVQDFGSDDGSRDDNGHGTNVAAVVSGVAPEAKLLGFDIFSAGGIVDDNALEAIDYVLDHPELNVKAVNLSFGTDDHFTETCTSPYTAAFAALRAAGILPVAAAGNDGSADDVFVEGLIEPACAAGALSVGAVYDSTVDTEAPGWGGCPNLDAVNYADLVTCFSQTADYLGMLAPGAFVDAAGIRQGGTSQATPHVAGAVAVLASARPLQTVDQRETSLTSSGPLITDARNNVSKHRLDLCAALAHAGANCSFFAPQNNDDRAAAKIIDSTTYFDRQMTTAYTVEQADPIINLCGIATTQNSATAWWTLTTDTSGTFSASTANSHYPGGGSPNDTVLAVHRLDGGNLVEVACNDDDGILGTSSLSVALAASTTYYVEVMGFDVTSQGGYAVLSSTYSGTLGAVVTDSLDWYVPPSNVPATVGFPNHIVVEAELANGLRNTADSDTTVTLSLQHTGPAHTAVLSCDGGLSKQLTDGIAMFFNCAVSEPYEGQFTIDADATSLSTGSSPSFRVTDPAFDATCNGSVDATDALAVLRALAGLTSGTLPVLPCTGDANGGGLGIGDTLAIRQLIALP